MEFDEDYKEILPPQELKDYIKYFWFYQHQKEDFEFTVLPDACFDLVIDFEDGILQNIFLTGVWTSPQKITVTKGTSLFAVRFKLLSGEYLFGMKMKNLPGAITVLPKNFWEIQSNCMGNFEDFSSYISGFLQANIEANMQIDDRKQKLFDLIYHQKIYRVHEISEKISWSPRQINRYFNCQFGFPLKTFIRMARCQVSYQDIANGRLYPSSEHTDQAHFIKEIKKYTDTTPKQLYKNENDRFIQLSPLKKR